MKLEKMDDFFTKRVEGYDSHMLEDVEGCKEGYQEIIKCFKDPMKDLLDLGCGTGIELDVVFKHYPTCRVTAIDLTQAMLDKLLDKYKDYNVRVLCDDYFAIDIGLAKYDSVLSSNSLHHFSHEKKLYLYKRIRASLKANGAFVNCDYMLESEEKEKEYFAILGKYKEAHGISHDEFVHFDTPLTVDNEKMLLLEAGFASVEHCWSKGNIHILRASLT